MSLARACCCSEATCCNAFAGCPGVLYIDVSASWAKTVQTLCAYSQGGCSIPAGLEVEAQSMSFLLRRLRATKETDGGGCTRYRIRTPDTDDQTGTMEFVASENSITKVSCPSSSNVYLYSTCESEFDTILDSTMLPDLTICDWDGLITVETRPGGKCRAVLNLSFDLCLFDGVVRTFVSCDSSSSPLSDTKDLCLRFELVMVSPDYDEGFLPCPTSIGWIMTSFTLSFISTACTCTENCGTCIEDISLPLTVCECPWTSTCGSQAGWTCFDIDYTPPNGCTQFQDVAWCYSADDVLVTITDT